MSLARFFRRHAGKACGLVLTCAVSGALATPGLSATGAAETTKRTRTTSDKPSAPQISDEAARSRASAAFGKLPLQFEANKGQSDARFDFVSRAQGYTLMLAPAEAVFLLPNAQKQTANKTTASSRVSTLRMKLVGANVDSKGQGLEKLPGRVNYFRGGGESQQHTDIETFARVRYESVYPGVDVIYYGNQRRLEYDFEVAPGADARRIRLEFAGAKRLKLEQASGDLLIETVGGRVRQHRPVAYQLIEGARREVAARYVLEGSRRVGLALGEYDRARPLVIDPVLGYSTYLGGTGSDHGHAVTVDADGNVYVSGFTTSTNFHTSPNAIDPAYNNFFDVFVTKLNPAGTAVLFSTYIGGSQDDTPVGVAVDAARNVYVSGFTTSHSYPTTPGAFQTTFANLQSQAAFVTKLNPSGSGLLYSTFLGGPNGATSGWRLAVDQAGDIYLAGTTSSKNFPVTSDAAQTVFKGSTNTGDFPAGLEGFVARLRPASAGASDLVYATYLGGGQEDLLQHIALDHEGSVYVAGFTRSSDFPVTPDAVQQTHGGDMDAFLVKLNLKVAGAAGLVYATYLGGGGLERCLGLAVDSERNAYLTGHTNSKNFPTTKTALQPSSAGRSDAFVVKINPARAGQKGLVYSTYLGGEEDEDTFTGSIAVDKVGNAYVSGDTKSINLPITAGAFQPNLGGVSGSISAPGGDAFIAKLNAAGTALVYFTYLGGQSGEGGGAIALNPSGDAYVTGYTFSKDLPTTAGTLQPAQMQDGSYDAWVARVDNPSSFDKKAANTTARASAAEAPNPIDDAQKFVRQHYRDFLNREPDASGLAFWTNQINECASEACREVRMINVSAAFFLSIEFQGTGYLVHRFYKASFGRAPRLREFAPDTRSIGDGVVVNTNGWQARLEANRRDFADAWVERADFKAAFDALSNAQYVDALYANAGVTPSESERQSLVSGLDANTETRASVLRRVAENRDFYKKEFNRAFVLMQYFGYMQRNPEDPPDADSEGLNFWLKKLDEHGGNYVEAEMVKAFIRSGEYRQRFGQS